MNTFQTQEVAELYNEVHGWCHPDHPFLDPNYSLGSYMPAIDYTPYIAKWILESKMEPIRELITYLFYDSRQTDYMLKSWLAAPMPTWLGLPKEAIAEIYAICLLDFRASFFKTNNTSQISTTNLLASRLCLHQGFLAINVCEPLLKAATAEWGKGSAGFCAEALQVFQTPLGEASMVAEKMALIPPMSRAVVFDYFTRGWMQGNFRYELYYDDRCYGCNAKWNQHYVEWLDFFEVPDDGHEKLPAKVTKEILTQILETHGISVKKDAKRSEMIDSARKIPGLIASIVHEHWPEKRQVKPEVRTTLEQWQRRFSTMLPIASGVHCILLNQSLKSRRRK